MFNCGCSERNQAFHLIRHLYEWNSQVIHQTKLLIRDLFPFSRPFTIENEHFCFTFVSIFESPVYKPRLKISKKMYFLGCIRRTKVPDTCP